MVGVEKQVSDAEALGLLGWWLEAGVDLAVQEEPRNWLKKETPPLAGSVATAAAPPAFDRQLPETLDLFRDWLGTAEALPHGKAGAKRILPHGVEGAPVMLLSDAPSAEDASAGRPMAGQAWELMERMLAAIGITADQAYCANISCFHVPGSRMSPDELNACATIARRHVALARPQRLLLLGDGPALALLGKSLASARGHVHTVEGVQTISTFHPRFLINRPAAKSEAWKDLLLLLEESS